MSKPTIEQIAKMAELACFYIDPQGLWLRIDSCELEDGYFNCHNEDSGEEYEIPFDEITLEGQESFQELVKMELNG
ncbi:hypothetical protein GW796_07570 [archaeon]|nr:hypothetical protein [archaeon]